MSSLISFSFLYVEVKREDGFSNRIHLSLSLSSSVQVFLFSPLKFHLLPPPSLFSPSLSLTCFKRLMMMMKTESVRDGFVPFSVRRQKSGFSTSPSLLSLFFLFFHFINDSECKLCKEHEREAIQAVVVEILKRKTHDWRRKKGMRMKILCT